MAPIDAGIVITISRRIAISGDSNKGNLPKAANTKATTQAAMK